MVPRAVWWYDDFLESAPTSSKVYPEPFMPADRNTLNELLAPEFDDKCAVISCEATLKELHLPECGDDCAALVPMNPSYFPYRALRDNGALLCEQIRHAGIGPGEVVCIVLPNGVPFLTVFLAVTGARAIAAPLNPAYKTEEFDFYLKDSGARAVIVPRGEHAARAAAARLAIPVWESHSEVDGTVRLAGCSDRGARRPDDAPSPDDVALFLHTSGTTSRPKGVPLTHENLMTSIRNIAATYALTPQDVGMVVMPLFHVHGLLGATLSSLYAGGKVIVPPRFSASSFWPIGGFFQATWYSAVPTIHQIVLAQADAQETCPKSLRFIRSCSAALAPVVHSRMENRFGVPVLEAYGMTEAAHQMASNPQPPGVRKAGTVGRGTGVEIVILDEDGNRLPPGQPGEVSIRGRNVTAGYHNNPEANAKAFTHGFFRTGDQGVLDADGYLTLTGRLKELINRGGEKISPLEVDAVLLEHPAVAEAVAFGVPDTKYGEEVHGAVVLKAAASADDILTFCRDRLADFKVPKRLHITRELPRTATGKIQRRHVAAHFQQNS
jgi:acyl-CoA synthetase (AMP-forming)/AMP-acid ligase II